MAHERKCTVCGKQYKYCPKCLQYSNMEKWHIDYCGEQCRNTYLTINKYIFKHIDKETAKQFLEGNKISINSNILPKWKVYVEEILKTEKNKNIKETEKKPISKRNTRKKKDIVNED